MTNRASAEIGIGSPGLIWVGALGVRSQTILGTASCAGTGSVAATAIRTRSAPQSGVPGPLRRPDAVLCHEAWPLSLEQSSRRKSKSIGFGAVDAVRKADAAALPVSLPRTGEPLPPDLQRQIAEARTRNRNEAGLTAAANAADGTPPRHAGPLGRPGGRIPSTAQWHHRRKY
jgi:hypothetical protein